jgi:murein DD-endopeptidase MepM/ murein hydrolase activator NlpD
MRSVPLLALLAVALGLSFWSLAAVADSAPKLDQPIACTIGTDCWVQNYVDHDAGPGARDFTCGHLTYDGHNGTDIRLPDFAAMRRGVPVLAAAPGTVARLRDGMADVSVLEIGIAALQGKDAGNSVVIDHGNGWETQYAHMMKGSIKVKIGQHVEAGQELGLVGLSGDTSFPHVHLTVRHDRKDIDPYTGTEVTDACGHAPDPIWTPKAARDLAYRPSGVLSAGLTDKIVKMDDILNGGDRLPKPQSDESILGFFASPFGLNAGDIQDMRLIAPDGSVLAKTSKPVNRDLAVTMLFIGARKPAGGWPVGTYRGEYELIRKINGVATPVAHAEREFVLK